MTLAAAPSGPQIVTVFNDRGPPLFSIAADNSTVTHQRGVSIVGWATSADGQAWSYKGKLATPGGWAALLGDPTIATDPTDDSVVYIATLALSTAGWNTQFGSTVNAVTSPMVPEPNGFCVARSTDGGTSFPASGCVQFQTDVDKTALTVDGTGRVWVAMEDKLNVTVRILALPGERIADVAKLESVRPRDARVRLRCRSILHRSGSAAGLPRRLRTALRNGSCW